PCAAAQPGADKAYPQRPVRIIVNVTPGGGVDNVARIVSQHNQSVWNQPFVVDNRTGAGGSIGVELAAKAAPDGYTLLVCSSGIVTTAAVKPQSYDPVRDLQPITILTSAPYIVLTTASLPVANVKDLIALAKAKPGAISFASSGTGGILHMSAELLVAMSGTQMLHVPYKGVAPALIDMMAGNLNLGYYTAVAALPHIKAGRLKAYGVTTEKRSDALPGVPAIGEVVSGYAAEHWYGLWGPRGIPRDTVMRLNQVVNKALEVPEIRDRIIADGFMPTQSTPEDFGKRLARDVARWKDVVKRGNIKIDTHG
ncbi:MAG: tripartite tricarboxylate transporter substrate binding protein, partial [Burkholderiales bacterium]